MAEKPILFSDPMANAVEAGLKTQTRRVAKARRRTSLFALEADGSPTWSDDYIQNPGNRDWLLSEAPCRPGDTLYVRQAFIPDPSADDDAWDDHKLTFVEWDGCGRTISLVPKALQTPQNVIVRADPRFSGEDWRWRPAMHMPRWASRRLLEVDDVRVERLTTISETDARCEGVDMESADPPFYYVPGIWPHSITAVGVEERGPVPHAVRSYAKLWEHLHGPGSWDENPLVWVITFRLGQNLLSV